MEEAGKRTTWALTMNANIILRATVSVAQLIFCLIATYQVSAQDTLSTRQLQEVVISATRSERALSELPVPVTVIQSEQIKSMGSLRLNEVLAEQTGLAIVSDHGTGIQMQGFSPEYTLILIDGEPLIGRTSGTLELNRVAVGNIKQIEIMKGPSSSLYGSEALAGVVNIITERPIGTNGTITSRYGQNNTFDLDGSVNYKREKVGLYLFANRYHTGGYDLSTHTEENTVSPFTNYTFQTRLTYDLSSRTRISLSGRFFSEEQESITNIGTSDTPVLLDGSGSVKDWNQNPVVTHNFSDKFKTTFRLYSSSYSTNSVLKYQDTGSSYDETYFDQTFTRPEIQMEYFINPQNAFTAGVGRIWESVKASRYDDKIKYQTNYAYAQYEWQPLKKLNVLAGGRFDDHSAYGSQFSPKMSLQYDLLWWLAVRGSFGVGFKAPDFRQLYLNFTNSTVGYSVFGSNVVEEGVRVLEAQGQIDAILVDPSTFGAIDAETSTAYNFGFKIQPDKKSSINVNFFHNNIKDLIDTKAVARKTNGQQVFSYYNVASVYTQGAEVDGSYSLSNGLDLSVGYQLLIAKDKDIVKGLDAGTIFARDPETNSTKRVNPDDYGGLFNRSRHMANAKLFYENKNGWSGSLRTIYRGRYGFADLNNNTILDDDSEYVDGYLTCNVSIGKTFQQWLKVQAGCDNIFNYTDAQYIPSLPGRLLWGSVALTISNKKIK